VTNLALTGWGVTPPPRHSPIITFLKGVSARLRLSLIQLIVMLFVLCFIWFPCILFPLFYFVLIFICILFLLGFRVFTLVFSCIASLCLFSCVFWFLQFCRSSPRLFRHSPATVGPFSAPPLRRTSNASFSVRDLLARDQCQGINVGLRFSAFSVKK
jgi:hypothetical protein